jgi:hypothetical protein
LNERGRYAIVLDRGMHQNSRAKFSSILTLRDWWKGDGKVEWGTYGNTLESTLGRMMGKDKRSFMAENNEKE